MANSAYASDLHCYHCRVYIDYIRHARCNGSEFIWNQYTPNYKYQGCTYVYSLNGQSGQLI